ncbi:MAG TPA: Crp/Fnr family transcriptional regulator [Rhizomicrobium sp.]|jgi:CRP-like cAMP-binding protein|nr:Crp/Fnr family transcriptional regulator [Rhizomicrobium sp.]
MANDRGRNHLLNALSSEDWARLSPALESVLMPVHRELEVSGGEIEHVYFLDEGIASVIAESSNGHQVETGIIGREGMTGIGVPLGDHRATQTVVMQISGGGYRIAADRLHAALTDNRPLLDRLLTFARAFMIQIAHTALSNGAGLLEQRLARWLLMLHDRVDGNTLAITHDYIATMLSVRRPGVSVALKVLEEQGLIRVNRGLIAVVDRQGLLEKAAGLYGRTELEYRRLLGWSSPREKA